jgi:WD40 repeat protein
MKKNLVFSLLFIFVLFIAGCATFPHAPPGAPTMAMEASALVFSQDGKTLAVGKGYKNAIIVYDFPQMGVKAKIRADSNFPLNPAKSLDFSADGTRLASAGFNESVIVWNPDNGSEITRLKDTKGVQALAFLPDGMRLVTVGPGNLIRIWDTATGEHLTDLSGHTEAVLAVACARNKPLIATASADRTIRLWDTNNWSQMKVLQGHLGPVQSITFSPDGDILASSANGIDVRLWQVDDDVGTQKYVTNIRAELEKHSKVDKTLDLFNLVFAIESIVTQGHPGVYGGLAEASLPFFEAPMHDLPHPPFNCPVTFSPDGKLLAFILFSHQLFSSSYHAIIVDVQSRKKISSYSGVAGVLSFSPDGKILATSGVFGIKLIDPFTGRKIQSE